LNIEASPCARRSPIDDRLTGSATIEQLLERLRDRKTLLKAGQRKQALHLRGTLDNRELATSHDRLLVGGDQDAQSGRIDELEVAQVHHQPLVIRNLANGPFKVTTRRHVELSTQFQDPNLAFIPRLYLEVSLHDMAQSTGFATLGDRLRRRTRDCGAADE